MRGFLLMDAILALAVLSLSAALLLGQLHQLQREALQSRRQQQFVQESLNNQAAIEASKKIRFTATARTWEMADGGKILARIENLPYQGFAPPAVKALAPAQIFDYSGPEIGLESLRLRVIEPGLLPDTQGAPKWPR
ncbi:MAG: hypothetical protein AB7U41_07385 [Dongiaceae bacterium]